MQYFWIGIQRRGRHALFTLLLALGLASFSPAQVAAQSESATDELLQLLDQTTSLQGHFSQQQYDNGGALLGESSGSFAMLRPGYFSWQIECTDSQLIIATPEFIWHHDIDLETVTRRPVDKSGVVSPLQILGGEEQLLRTQFTVSKSATGVFTLVPAVEAGGSNPGFQRLSLTLDHGVLAGMEIIDALSQRVLITFAEVDKSTGLSPQDFAFEPPDGVDLFYYDQ